MSFYEQLDQMKTAIKLSQTGTADDRMDYTKVTGQAGGVPLLGPYSIRSDEWAEMAANAGIEGARWQDGGAQEAVMSYQLTRLYNQYGGRWDGVALAWRAGEEAAELIVNQGYPISEVITGSGAEELQLYVNDVIKGVDKTKVGPGEFEDAATYEGPFSNVPLVDDRPRKVRETRDPTDVVMEGLTRMRGRAQEANPIDRENMPPMTEPEPEPEEGSGPATGEETV
jgi:hypothetical protein